MSSYSSSNGRFRSRLSRKKWGAPVVAGGALGLILLVTVVSKVFWGGGDTDLDLPPPRKTGTQHDLPDPSQPHYPGAGSSTTLSAVDELFERQSQTLEQAAARYRLKTDRNPPRGYDKWFEYAREKRCLVDDYDQIYRDFAPFYQLADKRESEKNAEKFFPQMVKAVGALIHEENIGMRTFTMQEHRLGTADEWTSNYDELWNTTLTQLGPSLPDFKLIINHRDEPRIAFDVRALSPEVAFKPEDKAPFRNAPKPTSKFYTDDGHCLVPNDPRGFLTWANGASSFLLYSASADFTTDLYPVLSQSKIYPCFSDILFPSPFHYKRSSSHPKYSKPDNVGWAKKRSVLYWRGQSTGGWIYGENYRSFPRFRLIDIAREPKNAGLMDVAITAFYTWFCQLEGCDGEKISKEYNITGENAPREEVYNYKYVLDVDGNAFSGRYLGLLASGSLVFKSTLFTEYFHDWLQPFEHYIPVRPDLSDLAERVRWAKAHDEEARRIQKAGKEFVDRVMTDAQNDCYFYLVLLEWARLHAGGH